MISSFYFTYVYNLQFQIIVIVKNLSKRSLPKNTSQTQLYNLEIFLENIKLFAGRALFEEEIPEFVSLLSKYTEVQTAT